MAFAECLQAEILLPYCMAGGLARPAGAGDPRSELERRRGRVCARGLMTMPPFGEPEAARPHFAALRELRDAHGGSARLPELSMGMSNDFEVAIEEGATLVRVGTAIFGARP